MYKVLKSGLILSFIVFISTIHLAFNHFPKPENPQENQFSVTVFAANHLKSLPFIKEENTQVTYLDNESDPPTSSGQNIISNRQFEIFNNFGLANYGLNERSFISNAFYSFNYLYILFRKITI